MANESPLDRPEWRALAREALDVWQEHLAFYASDPKAKDDLTHLIEPLAKMFAENGLGSAWTGKGATSSDAKPGVTVADLARRLAQVEKTVATLVSPKASPVSSPARKRAVAKPSSRAAKRSKPRSTRVPKA